MIRVLQIGEGNFLRAFAEVCFQELGYPVTVVKPRPGTLNPGFEKQNMRYHVVVRGMEQGAPCERVCPISAIDRMIHPFEDEAAFFAAARDAEVKLIVSNTTDAGIRFCAEDTFDGFATMTFPGKLTRLLYARWEAGLDGVYLLPTELIDNNADELKRCVTAYIDLWGLSDEFRSWNEENCYYCNTLVDRIVSGYPKEKETERHLETLIGERDELMTVSEPFGLWVVEEKGDIGRYLPQGKHGIDVILTQDVTPYKKQKVRILNCSHTNLAAVGLLHGAETVYDCMQHEKISKFIRDTVDAELLPFVPGADGFAEDVMARFENPYLNHRLEDLTLNCVPKWRGRVLPALQEYYEVRGKIPQYLTLGLSYLIVLYQTDLENRKDDADVKQAFAEAESLEALLGNEAIWGENLTKYHGFVQAVEYNVEQIRRGERL